MSCSVQFKLCPASCFTSSQKPFCVFSFDQNGKQEADLSSCFLLFVVVYLSLVSLGVWLNSILLLFYTSVLVGYFDFVMLFYFVGSCCLFINIPVHARCKQRDSKSQIHHNERFHNKLSQYFMRPVPQSRIRSLAR